MGMCKKCYKKRYCSERDLFGRCTQYRRIDEIREEVSKANDNWNRDSGTRTVNGVVRGQKVYAEIQVGTAAEVLRDGLGQDSGADNT